MNRYIASLLITAALLAAGASRLGAHCQIPCGIYNDPVRFTLLEEHITTIEKSINQINQLGQQHDHPEYNQLVRWVQNKEDHVAHLTEIVTDYFLAQRVKPADPKDEAATRKYVRQVTLLHQMIIAGMKAKQGTDLKPVADLRALLAQFKEAYEAK